MRKSLFFVGFLVLAPGCASDAFATCAATSTISYGQIADATQSMANIDAIASCADTQASSGVANSVQINNGAGGFGSINPLTDGQLIGITATGSAPQITTFMSGSGVPITNYPDVISIGSLTSASGSSPNMHQPTLPAFSPMTNLALAVSFFSKFQQFTYSIESH